MAFERFAMADRKRKEHMDKWACTICGYVYDPVKGYPNNGVAPGTTWKDVPHDWVCPICGGQKNNFIQKKSS